MTQAIAKQEPFHTYCNAAGLNQSRLSRMDYSPANFQANTPSNVTPALDDGRLIHLCALEPDIFDDTVVVWQGGLTKTGKPTTNTNSDAYREFKAEQLSLGKTVTDEDTVAMCRRVRNSVLNYSPAAQLLAEGMREISVYWDHEFGVKCKSRIDNMGPVTVDLKSTRDARPQKFNRSILEYSYHCQAAFYSDAVFALTGERRPYSIIAVEKRRPYDVVVYEMDDCILSLGRQTYTAWLQRYIECTEQNYWPGIAEEPVKAELPNWAYEEFQDDTLYIDGVAV